VSVLVAAWRPLEAWITASEELASEALAFAHGFPPGADIDAAWREGIKAFQPRA
jgi:hypothetical protein